MSATPLLKISDLSVQYFAGQSSVRALDGVSLEIPSKGYSLGVVGESGSGKTTLGMSIMNAIERPGRISGGRIEYEGTDILGMAKGELRNYRWKEVSMIFQSAMNSLNPVKTISHPIAEVMREHLKVPKKEAYKRAKELLSEVRVDPSRANAHPHEFSGGMRQRVVIALALALSPKLLIADEPTSALDVVVQKQILGMLREEVKNRGLSLIFITHEIPLLVGLVEKVAVMQSGKIVELGPLEKVLSNPLHPYTEMLIWNLLTMRTSKESLKYTGLDAHSEGATHPIQNACQYSDRCKYVFQRCKVESPVLTEAEHDRWVACFKYE
ncbi:MAG: ABC transporter ATP-binding protein [Thaumarchaeota archaeon]|nr:ABC transporter ATP-binding protein [Nitrososphaerota archaeon]